MNKINVLMISWDYSAVTKEKHIGDFPERLAEYGKHLSKLFVISYAPKDIEVGPRKIGKNVYAYPVPSRFKLSFVLNGFRKASRIIENEEIDLITCQDPLLAGVVGHLLKRKHGIPLLVQLHRDSIGNEFWVRDRIRNRALNLLGKFILKRADGIRVVSHRIKNRLKRMRVTTAPIQVLPIFIDIDKFTSEQELRKEEGTKALFAGRLTKEKDVRTLLRAFKKVIQEKPEASLEIVGDGPEKNKLIELTRSLGVEKNVVFEGAVPHDQMPKFYHSCDVFVLSSKYEGRGLVLIEAMACSKPVVTTDVGCAREVVIEGETGYIVQVGDPNALAEKILFLLQNPEKRIELGGKAKEYVKKTQDIKKNAYKLREFYEEIVRS